MSESDCNTNMEMEMHDNRIHGNLGSEKLAANNAESQYSLTGKSELAGMDNKYVDDEDQQLSVQGTSQSGKFQPEVMIMLGIYLCSFTSVSSPRSYTCHIPTSMHLFI